MRSDLLKQKRRKNIGLWIVILVLFILSFVFGVEAVKDWITLKKWDSVGVVEYQGNYIFYEKKNHRNVSYIFELANGDTIFIPSEELLYDDIDFESFEELIFRYTAHKDILRLGKHMSISISSIDKSLVLQQEESSMRDIRGLAILESVFSIIFSALVVLPLLFEAYLFIIQYFWKQQKCRKKRKK